MPNGFTNMIVFGHDPVHVALAVLICAFGSFLSVRMLGTAVRGEPGQRPYWIGLFAIIGGSVIWTTHFIAILGFRPDLVAGHDMLRVLLSLAVSVAGVALATCLAFWPKWRCSPELGGVGLGIAVAAMHFVGMSGFALPCGYSAAPATNALAVLLGCLGGLAAFNRVWRGPAKGPGASLSMGAAVALLHFTSMGALDLDTGLQIPLPAGYSSAPGLLLPVALVIAMILAIGLVSLQIERVSRREGDRHIARAFRADALTSLPNRTGFIELLEGFAEADGRLRPLLLLAVDIAGFKHVNNVHGHAAGDEVLKETAARLVDALPPGGLAARVGADEFYAVLPGHASAEEACCTGSALAAALSHSVAWNGKAIRFGIQAGLILCPAHADSPGPLIAGVETALQDAKQRSRNMVSLFDEEMARTQKDRRKLGDDLLRDFDERRLTLHFQPQLDLRDGRIVGFEALLRWFHEERGAVPPDVFIPIAEERGLIQPLGCWVLQQAVREAASWGKPVRIAVNVAAAQFEPGTLHGSLCDVLEETGFAPDLVELEITESTIIEDLDSVRSQVAAFRKLGVKLAMDDYGTGYSALSTLLALPFDKIKFDKSFVQGMDRDPRMLGILKSTVELGRNLGISVLAEGVETPEQLEILRKIGCDEVQGFLIGRPMSGQAARCRFGLGLSDVERWDQDLRDDRSAVLDARRASGDS